MINLQLYILNDERDSYDEVELYDNESVTYTQSLQDVKDINKIFSDFSRTFNVPASKKNNKIFKHFHNYFIDGFDAKKRYPAKLYLNYELYKEGFLKLEGATTKDNRAFTYRVTFFGSGIVLKDIFKDTKLSGLGLLIESFNFDYTSANVVSYLQDGLDQELLLPSDDPSRVEEIEIKDAIVFPLISHTTRIIFDSSSSYATDGAKTNLANVTNGGLDLAQLKPAIRVHAIIKAIEASFNIEGRKIKFTEDFFNTTNLSYYNLYLWLHTKTGSLFEDQEANDFFTNFTLTNVSSKRDTVDNRGIDGSVLLIESGNTFITPTPNQGKASTRLRKADITIFTSSSQSFTVLIFKDGEEFKSYELTQTNNRAVVDRELILPAGSYTFGVRSAVSVEFRLVVDVKRAALGGVGYRQVEYESTITTGTDKKIYAASQMPDMTILDFLTGLFKLFNLTAFQDENGNIKVQTLDQFFAASDKIYNVTEFIDKDTVTIDSVVPYRKIDFKYKGTNTFLAKFHKDIFNIEWGSLNSNKALGLGDNRFGSDYTVEIPFEHMKFERLVDINDNSAVDIQIGWSVDEKQDATIGDPLLFYAVSHPIKKQIKIINFDSSVTTIAQNTNIYLPSNSIELGDVLKDSANLNFNAERNEFSNDPFENTLFKQFYENYIKEIFDIQRRITKTKAYLPHSILLNIKLNDKILIGDKLYKINTLTTDYQQLLTTLELINTSNVAGKIIVTDTVFRDEEIITESDCTTVDDDSTTIDSVSINVDCTGVKYDEGFRIIKDSNDGTDAEKNQPELTQEGEPSTVTAPSIFDPFVTVDNSIIKADTTAYKADMLVREVTSSSFKIGYQVKTLGKIATADNLDAYGFLYSTTSADLEGTDVDDIAAVGGVTQINYPTESNFKRPPVPFTASYENNSASSSTTFYFRFYARTNTDINYNEADALSEIEEITTA